ncbi:MAG: hypothetical protein JST19_03720 [Bacteroidetes bacterium]|nr:hypothetical protein [Bacteroidota bacterium]
MNWTKLLASICAYSRTTTIGIMPEKITTALLPGRYCREFTEQGYLIKESLNIIPGKPDADFFKIVRTIYLLQADKQTPVNYQEEERKASYDPYTQEVTVVNTNKKYFFIPEEDLLSTGTCLYKKVQGIYNEDEFVEKIKQCAL